MNSIFAKIIEGETWCDRIFLGINQDLPPSMVYESSGRGYVILPPNEDPLVVAYWSAHESGHLEYHLKVHPPLPLMMKWEAFIRSSRSSLIRKMMRQVYYLVFFREKIKEELYALKVAIRLLKKGGFSPKAVSRGDRASRSLVPPKPRYALVERLFDWYLTHAQRKIFRAAW